MKENKGSGKKYRSGLDGLRNRLLEADAKSLRLSKLYAAQTKITEVIIRSRDISEIYEKACRISVESGLIRMAWIGHVDPETRLVTPVARCGCEDGYLDAVKISVRPDIPEGKGPTGSAIREGRYFVSNDTENDPLMGPWRGEVLKQGYLSAAAFPFKDENHVWGAITFYASEPYCFDEEAIELLGSVADNISFAVEHLRREEEITFLASIIKNIPDAVLTIDLNGDIVSWNEGAERMMGFTSEEAIGRSITMTIPETLAQGELAHCLNILKTEGSLNEYESVRLTKDGKTIPVEITAAAMRDRQQNIVSYTFIMRDISERKRTEETLRISEERFRLAMLGANDGLWDWNLKTNEVYYSPRWKSMLGYSETELNGHLDTWKLLVHPDDLEPSLAVVREFLEGRTDKYEMEFRMRHKDGHYVNILSRAFLVYNDQKEPIRLVGTHVDVTQREQAEEALRQSEARFSKVFHNSPVGIVISLLSDGTFIDVNNAFLDVYGYSRAEIIGRSSLDLQLWVNHEDRTRMAGTLRAQGRVQNLEAKFRRKSGEIGDLLISAELIELAGLQCILGMFSDITERKKAEQLIADALAFNKAVVDSSPVAILTYDASGQCLSANEGAAKAVGTTVDGLLKQNYHHLKSWRKSGMAAAADAAMASGEEQSLDAHIVTTFGRKAWYACRFVRFKVGGEPHLLVMISDITERKRAEKALKGSEKKYRDLVDNASIGIYKSTLDGRFLYVNKVLADLFEFISPEEMMSEGALMRYKNPQDRIIFLDKLKKSGEVHNFELETRTKSGKPIHLLFNSTLEGDTISGMVLNITKQKKLEAQLRHSQKMEAIGTLAGGIAHDFNNILNAILGFGALALDKLEKGHPSADDLQEVLAAAERAANLTQRLLAFSRKQVSDLKTVDINEIVISTEKMLSRIIGEDIRLITDLTGKEILVMVDFGQIEQVLMNLAANARDAMPKGGVLTIDTGLREIDDEFIAAHGYGEPGRYAFISIADNGTGIDAETQKKIFEPFFTTKGVGKGTGLGLSMAYGIIKQHGGFINVYSEVGKGTTFKILLPLNGDPADRGRVAAVYIPLKGGKETILVAEDDASLRKLSRIVLESFGYSVITAEDGEDAVMKFVENRDSIHLVILDMIMPKKNGREAYEEIRKTSPDVKVLFASGYTMDIMDKRELIAEGMDFILKPVSPRDLVTKVREVLDR